MKYNYPVLETLFYYGVFCLLLLPFLFADLCVENKKASKLCAFLGATLMFLFAGFRGLSVGTDTVGTLDEFFWPSLPYRSWSQILSAENNLREPFYFYMSFLLQKITRQNWIFLLFMQVLTTGPVAIYAYKQRHTTPISITMFVFIMLFYQCSFNLARHCAAASFLLLAAYYYKEHQ